MGTPTIIYCASGNARLAQIAIDHGMKYGAQLPGTIYHPLYFADQNWKSPDRARYMQELQIHRPHLATVLDLETPNQLAEVLSWAEDAAIYTEHIIIIPKYSGAISHLPRTIAGKPVRLGYSVPTRYAGTEVPIWEFQGWPVHLLGGSPQKQLELAKYLNVHSADGNYIQKAAVSWVSAWHNGKERYAKNRYFPTLREMGISPDTDAPYKAFEISCRNVMKAWANHHPA